MKGQAEREKYTQPIAEFQRITRRDKTFLNEQSKEIEENNRMERLEICSRRLERSRGHFMQEWAK